MRRALLGVLLSFAGWGALAPTLARADEPVLLSFEASALVPLASPQSERFGVGGSVGVAVRYPLTPWLLGGARLRTGLLSDGPAPADTSLADPGVGGLHVLGLGLRLRPMAFFDPSAERGSALWIDLDAGAGLTGDFVRPVFDVGVGWNIDVGPLDIGPFARFSHVLHFDDPLDDRSAFVLSLGVEVVLFDARDPPPEAPPGPSDRDGDGLEDSIDQCPDEPEDSDGFEDEDGCPDLDNDRDGIPDADDGCPIDPEDRDGFEDENGCPDTDNDRDLILDADDACPNEPEVINGIDDLDGCPDQGLITMIDDRIVLDETVLFDFNRARVKHSARPILEAIRELQRQHPEWTRVRVEGHADARGDAGWNQRLSEERASRVRDVLVELGMPIGMIEVVGFGAARPREEGTSEAAHQANRRVEFVVVSRSAPDAAASTGATP